MSHRKIPCYTKWLFAVFMAVFIPGYWIGHGPSNFLWFSDIVLFLAFFATLFESRFLASMAAAGGFIFLSLWNVDFVFTLFTYLFDIKLAGFTAYIFNSESSVWLRTLSLFHVALPFLLLWLIYRLGYHKRAWIFQTAFFGTVILVTWLVTDPSRNINVVFSYKIYKWVNMGAASFLLIEFV
ncbi:MAG: hypothetical protein K940chlam8_00792, partial [Chlamydiae bacterium]|nr:hypothetical protein [Chlamydiota bacterium]